MREKTELGDGKQKTRRLVKMVSFTKNDSLEFDYLDKMDNYSPYVINLIRKDMGRGGVDKFQKVLDELEDIKKILTNGNFTVEQSTKVIDSELKDKMLRAISVFVDDEDE